MLSPAIFLAATEATESDLLGSLGIDVQLLVLQSVAFLLLLFVLARFVFPSLSAMLERREKAIEESLAAAAEADKKAAASEKRVTELLHQARLEADTILATAKTEASELVEAAETKSRKRAEQIVADAEVQLEKDVEKARQTLQKDTLELVAHATERVLGAKLDASLDKKVIERALRTDGQK